MKYHLTFDRPGRLFRVSGLEFDPSDGTLGLARLPGDPVRLGPLYPAPVAPQAVAGVASDGSGRVYAADPAGRRVWRATAGPPGETDPVEPWPPGFAPGTFRPTALWSGRLGLVWVADQDSGRVLLLDGETGTPRGEPLGPFDRPGFLTADASGRVYVSDAAGVTRFTPGGRPDPFPHPVRRLPGVPGRDPGPVAVLPATGEVPETLVYADGPWLRRLGLDGGVLKWGEDGLPAIALPPGHGAEALPLFPAAGPDLLNPLEVPLLVPGAPPVAPDSPGRVTALAAWDGKLWLGLAEEPAGAARLHAFDPSTLRLALAAAPGLKDLTVGGLAVARTGPGTACRGIGGRLLVHDPAAASVVALRAGAARQTQGALLAGPFDDEAGLGRWYRVTSPGACPEGTRFRFLTLTTGPAGPADVSGLFETLPPPAPPWFQTQPPPTDTGSKRSRGGGGPETRPQGGPESDPPETAAWTPPGRWREAPDDALDARLWHEPGRPQDPPRRLWLAAFFLGDGGATPALRPVTVEAGHEGWERDLPAIYQRDALTPALAQGDGSAALPPPTLLDGLLGLFEASAGVTDAAIDGLPAWFDPRVTADPQGLATHLGIDPGGLTPDRLRGALGAFSEVAGRRGTSAGLRRSVESETGVSPVLVEPIQTASLWVLGSTGSLGALTQLAPGPTGGAILDETATLDQARLTGRDDAGAALWDDLVGRVVARVYAAEVRDPATRLAVERCLRDRAPAHAGVVVEVIGPRARVGYQATLGLDAVLASASEGARPLALGDPLGPEHPLEGPAPARPAGAAWLGHDALPPHDTS